MTIIRQFKALSPWIRAPILIGLAWLVILIIFATKYVHHPSQEPTLKYELMRRHVITTIQEMSIGIQGDIDKIRKSMEYDDRKQLIDQKLDEMLEMVSEHKRSLLNDMNYMREMDGYDNWRRTEAKLLSDLVQHRLTILQHPADCERAKKLVCRIEGCGFGCEIHHVVACLIMAQHTKRTLILLSEGWNYHSKGWEGVFQPLSDTCNTLTKRTEWTSEDQMINYFSLDDLVNLNPSQFPLANDLASRINRLHGNPNAWWMGQLLKYLLRMQPETQTILDNVRRKLGYTNPIVGVHIRRTDKLDGEAALYTVDEYMRYVEEFYLQLEMVQKIDIRRVFLATDEPMVIDEARRKYPQYQILSDHDVARIAATDRYSDSSLSGIIRDIHLLSMSDYLVCTFSSNVCRLAFEIMQTRYPDASNRVRSLDDVYFI